MIIIILPIILLLLLLTFFLYIQKKKVMSLQQQIGDLQNKISILEKQYLAAEQYKDSLRQEAYTVHLYASLSLEEAKKTSIKDKQSQIIRSSEHTLPATRRIRSVTEKYFHIGHRARTAPHSLPLFGSLYEE